MKDELENMPAFPRPPRPSFPRSQTPFGNARRETPFRVRPGQRKRSFPAVRSQTEFGNEQTASLTPHPSSLIMVGRRDVSHERDGAPAGGAALSRSASPTAGRYLSTAAPGSVLPR